MFLLLLLAPLLLDHTHASDTPDTFFFFLFRLEKPKAKQMCLTHPKICPQKTPPPLSIANTFPGPPMYSPLIEMRETQPVIIIAPQGGKGSFRRGGRIPGWRFLKISKAAVSEGKDLWAELCKIIPRHLGFDFLPKSLRNGIFLFDGSIYATAGLCSPELPYHITETLWSTYRSLPKQCGGVRQCFIERSSSL